MSIEKSVSVPQSGGPGSGELIASAGGVLAGAAVVGVGACVVACAGAVKVTAMAVHATYNAVDNELSRQADAAKQKVIGQATEMTDGITSALENCSDLGNMAENCVKILQNIEKHNKAEVEKTQKAISERKKEQAQYAAIEKEQRKEHALAKEESRKKYIELARKKNESRETMTALTERLSELSLAMASLDKAKKDISSGISPDKKTVKNKDDMARLLQTIQDKSSVDTQENKDWLAAVDAFASFQAVLSSSKCFSNMTFGDV